MEKLPEPDKAPHFFIHPDVIETHIARGTPIPIGTVKLLWILNQLFKDDRP